jgi:hypothetical protein
MTARSPSTKSFRGSPSSAIFETLAISFAGHAFTMRSALLATT